MKHKLIRGLTSKPTAYGLKASFLFIYLGVVVFLFLALFAFPSWLFLGFVFFVDLGLYIAFAFLSKDSKNKGDDTTLQHLNTIDLL